MIKNFFFFNCHDNNIIHRFIFWLKCHLNFNEIWWILYAFLNSYTYNYFSQFRFSLFKWERKKQTRQIHLVMHTCIYSIYVWNLKYFLWRRDFKTSNKFISFSKVAKQFLRIWKGGEYLQNNRLISYKEIRNLLWSLVIGHQENFIYKLLSNWYYQLYRKC